MTTAQSAKLKEGARVLWNNDPNDQGTVLEVGYACVKITWDNGQTGTIDHRDMTKVT